MFLMDALKLDDYFYVNCQQVNDVELLKNGVFLVVLYANKIPPHIGLLIDGKFYSDKVGQPDIAVDFSHLSRLILSKSIPSLFVKLKDNCGFDLLQIKDFILSNQLSNNEYSTCLTPIAKILNFEHAKTVFDLLEHLTENNQIEKYLALCLPKDFKGIPYYTVQSVYDRIHCLKNN